MTHECIKAELLGGTERKRWPVPMASSGKPIKGDILPRLDPALPHDMSKNLTQIDPSKDQDQRLLDCYPGCSRDCIRLATAERLIGQVLMKRAQLAQTTTGDQRGICQADCQMAPDGAY